MKELEEPKRFRGTWGPKYKRKVLWEGKDVESMKHIALYQTGRFWDCASITRVFSSVEKAVENIPKGFEQIGVDEDGFSYHNSQKKEWLNIKHYEVE